MKVKDMIEVLRKIEDKNLDVCITNRKKEYMPDSYANTAVDFVERVDGRCYLDVSGVMKTATYVLIDVE